MDVSDAKEVLLPPVVNLDMLDGVRDELAAAIDAGDVRVAASGVERLSTNTIFLLVSAAQSARQAGHAFSISGASQPLLDAADRLGLSGQISDLIEG